MGYISSSLRQRYEDSKLHVHIAAKNSGNFTYDGIELGGERLTREIEDALENPVDFKSALQERLARRGELVSYDVVDEEGPPHDRVFSVRAMVEGREVARGTGRSKKDAEQEAAQVALEALE